MSKKMREQLKGAVVLRHEDYFSAGIPDFSVTLNGTTWIEVKHAKPYIKGKKIQAYTADQLNKNGRCFYVVYRDIRGVLDTLIIDPAEVLKDIKNCMNNPITAVSGFSHQYVIDFLLNKKFNYLTI